MLFNIDAISYSLMQLNKLDDFIYRGSQMKYFAIFVV